MSDILRLTADELNLLNAREAVAHLRQLRKLELKEQQAKTAKAETELKVQQLLLEVAQEHRRALDLPKLKLGEC
jgi:hypothetical protein